MDLQGPDFSDSRDPILSDSRDPMIIFSDSRDPIWNSRDPNRVPETPLKKPCMNIIVNKVACTLVRAKYISQIFSSPLKKFLRPPLPFLRKSLARRHSYSWGCLSICLKKWKKSWRFSCFSKDSKELSYISACNVNICKQTRKDRFIIICTRSHRWRKCF